MNLDNPLYAYWQNRQRSLWNLARESLSLEILSFFHPYALIPYRVYSYLRANPQMDVSIDVFTSSLPCDRKDLIVLIALARDEGIESITAGDYFNSLNWDGSD